MSYRRINLTRPQLLSIAGILREVAQVLFASLVVAPLVSNNVSWSEVILGMSAVFLLWYVNIVIIGEFSDK